MNPDLPPPCATRRGSTKVDARPGQVRLRTTSAQLLDLHKDLATRKNQAGRLGMNLIWLGFLGLLAVSIVGLCTACTITGDDIYPVLDDIAPEVVRTFPEQNWIQVPRSVVVKVWFSEPVESCTVGLATMTLFSGDYFQRCRYKVKQTQDGLGLVEMSPMEKLLPGVEYQLDIYQGISDLNGNPLDSAAEVSFTTMEH